MTDLTIRKYRTVFISDVHLGTKGCQAELLLDFIRHIECDTLYLVGDIVDGWKLRSGWYWPQAHNDVVQKILRMARKGVRVVYVPGNHDDRIREFIGIHFGGVVVARDAIHETADGRRFLVLHGDEFDVVVRHARVVAYLGDWAYDAAIAINVVFAAIRRKLGLPYWSFSSWAKQQVKTAVNFIGEFQKVVVEEARRNDADGVICGHIHHASMRDMNGIAYVNTGDWVESCTAIAENHDGSLEIIRWTRLEHERQQPLMLPRAEAAE